jgi:hypothetical protein
VQTTTFGELSAHDVLRADWLLFSDRTLPTAVSDFSGTHVAADTEPEAEENTEGAQPAAPEAEAAEAAPAKPRARRAKAVAEPEPEVDSATEDGTEEADADA